MFLKFSNRLGQLFNTLVLGCHRAHNRRMPAVPRHHQRQHSHQLLLQAVRAFTIGFVQNKNVANLHETGLHVLDVITEPRHKHHEHTIGHAHDVDCILANAHGLDQHMLLPGRIQEQRHFSGRASQAAEKPTRGHRANKCSRIAGVPLHANAIAQNGSSGIGARRIDGDDAHLFVLPAVKGSQTIDQCALPRDRKSTRLNSSHVKISYAVFCLKKKKKKKKKKRNKKKKKIKKKKKKKIKKKKKKMIHSKSHKVKKSINIKTYT